MLRVLLLLVAFPTLVSAVSPDISTLAAAGGVSVVGTIMAVAAASAISASDSRTDCCSPDMASCSNEAVPDPSTTKKKSRNIKSYFNRYSTGGTALDDIYTVYDPDDVDRKASLSRTTLADAAAQQAAAAPVPVAAVDPSLRIGKLLLCARDVGGAGDCFFRCIAAAVYLDAELHAQVRLLVVDYMREHRGEFEAYLPDDETFEAYVLRMSRTGTWVEGEAEIIAASRALNIVIRVWGRDEHRDRNIGDPSATTLVQLLHLNECHFQVVEPMPDGGDGPSKEASLSRTTPAVSSPVDVPETVHAIASSSPAAAAAAAQQRIQERVAEYNQRKLAAAAAAKKEEARLRDLATFKEKWTVPKSPRFMASRKRPAPVPDAKEIKAFRAKMMPVYPPPFEPDLRQKKTTKCKPFKLSSSNRAVPS